MTRPAFCIPIHIPLYATLGDGAGLANTGRIVRLASFSATGAQYHAKPVEQRWT